MQIKRSCERVLDDLAGLHYTPDEHHHKKHNSNGHCISGYASVFGVEDHHHDVVVNGAFAKTEDSVKLGRQIPLLWQHMSDKPIGSVEDLKEDQYGLYIVAKIIPTIRYGMEALELIKSRIICGFSIGYNPTKHFMDYENNVRILEEIDLWEVSLVTFPANPDATVSSF